MLLSKRVAKKSEKGLNRKKVIEISEKKNEPGWMTNFRLKALAIFESMQMPNWGVDLSELNSNDLHFYIKPVTSLWNSWEDVPDKIKKTVEA